MPRRAGGRQARHALRSAPLSEETKPVRAGIQGGSYRPLSNSNIAAIDENIFRILEEIGFKDATPHCIETCVAAGAILGDDERLRMPRDVVENALNKAERNLVLYGQDPINDQKCSLSINVYMYKQQFAPIGFSWIVTLLYIRPLLRKYLFSVVNGFEYYLQTGKPVSKNHFGVHPWFSVKN